MFSNKFDSHIAADDEKQKYKKYVSQSIQEGTKYILSEAAFKNFYLVHSSLLCPTWSSNIILKWLTLTLMK